MVYAAVSDMIARFGEIEMIELTDRELKACINVSVAYTALEDASAEIDGYLSRFTQPIDPKPKILTVYCCDIARYRLSGADVQETDVVTQRYMAALQFLTKVAEGKITLGGMPDGEQASTNNIVMFSDKQKVFGRDNPY